MEVLQSCKEKTGNPRRMGKRLAKAAKGGPPAGPGPGEPVIQLTREEQRPGSVVRSLVRWAWGMRQGAERRHRLHLVRPPGGLRSSKWNSEQGVRWPGQAEALLPSVTLPAQPRARGVRTQPGHRWPQAPRDHHIPSSLCTKPSAHAPELE